jgi:hypothetical protein
MNAGIVDVPDSPSLALDRSFTFEGWLRLDGYTGTIIEKRATQGVNRSPISIGIQPTGQLSWNITYTDTGNGGGSSSSSFCIDS